MPVCGTKRPFAHRKAAEHLLFCCSNIVLNRSKLLFKRRKCLMIAKPFGHIEQLFDQGIEFH